MSNRYTLTITLQLPALIGSGEGFGAIIDSDIVFDDLGIPYIPAKRIKGCLRDAAQEVKEMFDLSNIHCPLDIDNTFGIAGAKDSAPVYFSNLTIREYEENTTWLRALLNDKNQYGDMLSGDSVLDYFTELRQQTAIGEDGRADEHSLRTVRLIQAGHCFSGEISIANKPDPVIENTLKLATLNFRHIGTKRNRGFGEIACSLTNEQGVVPVPKHVEDLCTR